MEARTRVGVSRSVLAFALALVVAVTGVATYVTLNSSGPPGSTSSASSSAPGGSTSLLALPEISMVPPPPSIPLISPGETQNYSAIQVQASGTSLNGTLTMKVTSPSGLSFLLNQASVALSGNTQFIPVVLKADPGMSIGNYSVTVQFSSGGFASENKTFTVGVVADLVVMQAVAFHPQNITVSKGTRVTWMNLDSTIGCCDPGNHDVYFLSGANASSPLMKRYDTWSYTFGADGTIEYYCSIHPYMKGQVSVTG